MADSDPTETGMARLSLNDADKQIRDWFMATAETLKCKTSVDQMGNLFAVRPGKNPTAPPIMMGSHLDTQPTGGRYDGILGVNAGLEVLKVLHENNVETEGSIGVVDWTNEEGARFPMMAVSSGVWAEAIPLETAWNLEEVSPGEDGHRRTMKQELERIGYLGPQPASYKAMPMAAHFELHIEQGPILERERKKIGVVKGKLGRVCTRGVLTSARCASIQVVRNQRQRSGHSCWHNSIRSSDGLNALCSKADCRIQQHREATRWSCNDWDPQRPTRLYQHYGSHGHLHPRYPTRGG